MIKLALASLLLIGCASNPASSNFNTGTSAFDSGDYKSAMKSYVACSYQGNLPCMHNAGVCQEKLGSKEEAIAWYSLAARYGFQQSIITLSAMNQPVPKPDLMKPQMNYSSAPVQYINSFLNGYNRRSSQRTSCTAVDLGGIYDISCR